MNTITATCYDAPSLQLPCVAQKRTLTQAIGQLTSGHCVDSPLASVSNRTPASFRDLDAKQICEQMREQPHAAMQELGVWDRAFIEQVRVWDEAFQALNTEAKPYIVHAAEMAERKQLAVLELERAIADAQANGKPTERLADDLQVAKRERNTWRWLLRKRGLNGDQTAPLHEQFEHFVLMHGHEHRLA